jgi:type I restriction-modification system DNA methylase subunit
MAPRRTRVEDLHAEWLSLVERSGPFLTVPVLKRALPDGLEQAPTAASSLRLVYDEWRGEPTLQSRWIVWVLRDLLELGDGVSEARPDDPRHRVAEHGVTVSPSFVVRDRTGDGEPAVMLVHVHPNDTDLDRPLRGDAWVASPIDRACELARSSGIELALVTNGSVWTLVWARAEQARGTCSWRSEIWLEEAVTLRAFTTLLGARRFFVLPAQERLRTLLSESAERQQEVADQLGSQVRRAVELLIATLDHEDRERHGALLSDLGSEEVYRGAVTVMMRLVFLFVAEERKLLPIEDQLYAETLAASTLRAQLQERADRDGEDPLERSQAAWHRVLALFRAVHSGIEHDALRLPAYGGGLFDPDRYPFLEGRKAGTRWQDSQAQPLPVDDRTMLHLLDSLQALEQQGARVLLSYSALDVEQIGHVYEGLLDHTAVRLTEHALALTGRLEPELRLSAIEQWAEQGDELLHDELAKATGRSVKAIAKGLGSELSDEQHARLRAACGGDEALLARVAPYHALLRSDLRGDPLVLPAGSLFVTQALDRRDSGTYYTPRQLAEDVVQHALDPIVYRPGPAELSNKSEWKLRPASELLDLKIADIAMGSGAFLVAACRYLAAQLQQAWKLHGPHSEEPLPADPLELELLAYRLIAERCLYGVDRNPMAVEMAKLSLWLLTVARDRPFSFVDHALRTGDSLLGITDPRQLHVLHLDRSWHRQASLSLDVHEIDRALREALELREELEGFVVRDALDAQRKATLLARSDEALADARLLGDLIVGAALSQLEDADAFTSSDAGRLLGTVLDADASDDQRAQARASLRKLSEDWLVERKRAIGTVAQVDFTDRKPFHWAIEFPEVGRHDGFDAIVGNPPFQGGQKITGALGTQYRDYLVRWIADGTRGSADLVAYFYLRAASLLRPDGDFGLIATNTLAQGDTREVGLDRLVDGGMTIYRAVASEPWPGGANLEMATVWARRQPWRSDHMLDRVKVSGITPALAMSSRVSGNAHRLVCNAGQSFQGSNVLGMGFVLSPDEAAAMIAADQRNDEVVKPYLVGEDLNQRPDCSPARWVIDFRDWPEGEARKYEVPFERVERLVRPEREVNRYSAAARNRWWQFERSRAELYRAVRGLTSCILVAQTSKTMMPVMVGNTSVYSHTTVVLCYEEHTRFAVLSSNIHWWWAVTHAPTMRNDVRYTPTDCFETFAQPTLTLSIGELGAALHAHRSALMLERQEGLTTTYNRVHNPQEHADDVARLRELHVELDLAVADAYGWSDLDLGHDFHDTKFGTRFTFAPVPRQEVLDRLLELNHARYAEEVQMGLHKKKKATRKVAPTGAMTMDFGGV